MANELITSPVIGSLYLHRTKGLEFEAQFMTWMVIQDKLTDIQMTSKLWTIWMLDKSGMDNSSGGNPAVMA